MPRRQGKVELNLFPFLSILCGLIAILMLFMIVILSTRVIEDTAQAKVSLPPPPPPSRENGRQTEGDKDEVSDGIPLEEYQRIEAEIDRLAGVLAQRRNEQVELARQRDRLRDLIEAKKIEQLAVTKLKKRINWGAPGEPTPVDIVPAKDGPASGKVPVFIECKAEGYLVHPGETTYAPFRHEKRDGSDPGLPDPAFLSFLQEVDRENARKYLVLLVHPNGVQAFWDAKHLLERQFANLSKGYEPFAKQWRFSRQ